MKQLSYSLVFFALICFSSFSCKKNDTEFESNNSMSFLLDGKEWTSHSNDFKVHPTDAFQGTSGFIVEGLNSVSKLTFTLKYPQIGTYQFTNKDIVRYVSYQTGKEYFIDINDESNVLEITEYSKERIKGKFSLLLKNYSGELVRITNGKFNIEISRR